ncbi:MAG TPA: hypothetical protein VEJ67_18450 [Candidatus Cybelea sp.]|nr:hypothetical protein [Candidatus Cybelea sp.]
MNALATTVPKLLHYDKMCQEIQACSRVDEAKVIRAKAIALAAYAKQAQNHDNEKMCCKIRIRAERRTGQLLAEAAKNGTRQKRGRPAKNIARRDILPDHGITLDQSSDWQKLASIPEEKFEEELARPGIPTTDGVLQSVYPKKLDDPLKRPRSKSLKMPQIVKES